MERPGAEDRPLLTPRQLEVLELVAKGLTNGEIADVLGITRATARNHVSAVIEALDVTNRTEAAVMLQELRAAAEPEGGVDAEAARFRVPGFGGRPAIAVLPFEPVGSDDRELEFLADGLAEELTTRLSCYRWFPIIARNSAFAYKGRRVDVREVSRDLAARYLVDGSLRPLGDRLRVTVRVLDGTTGEQVWTDRYDRTLEELLHLQDQVVDDIVGSLDPVVSRIERLRAGRAAPQSPGAWERFQRGLFHLYRETEEELARAEEFLAAALELDPLFAPAHAGIAQIHCIRLAHEWSRAPLDSVRRALEAAHRGVELDPTDPVCLGTLGFVHTFTRQSEAARAAFERAIELNPSYAVAHWGLAAAYLDAERTEETIALLEKAIRLSPRDPMLHHVLAYLAAAHLMAGDREAALRRAEESRHARPDQPFGHAVAAACLAQAGRRDEARAAWAELRRAAPRFDPEYARPFLPPALGTLLVDAWKRMD